MGEIRGAGQTEAAKRACGEHHCENYKGAGESENPAADSESEHHRC